MRPALILVSWTLLVGLTPSPDFSSRNRGTGSRLLPHRGVGGIAPLDRAAAAVRRRSAAPLESTLRGRRHPTQPAPFAKRRELLSRGLKEGTGSSFSVGEERRIGTNRRMSRSWKAAGSVPRARRRKTLNRSSQAGAAPTRPVDLVRFSDDPSHRAPWRYRDSSPPRRALPQISPRDSCAGPAGQNAGQASGQLCHGHSIRAVCRNARL